MLVDDSHTDVQLLKGTTKEYRCLKIIVWTDFLVNLDKTKMTAFRREKRSLHMILQVPPISPTYSTFKVYASGVPLKTLQRGYNREAIAIVMYVHRTQPFGISLSSTNEGHYLAPFASATFF